ncbi:MAG: hypothetical protein BAJALOKI3v1_30080 [Promethearchaeota archaeon]|nr:MAG: hypothetical protein BAJALOKI3v1_30080 [Candidatus Lokiarchaeota archaeon]
MYSVTVLTLFPIKHIITMKIKTTVKTTEIKNISSIFSFHPFFKVDIIFLINIKIIWLS